MTGWADFLLLVVAVLSVAIVATSRLTSCVRASALQGLALALLPLALWGRALDVHLVPVIVMSLGALAVKAIIIPLLLSRAIREANVRREAEPFISQHFSLLIAAALVGFSFWLGTVLVLPRRFSPGGSCYRERRPGCRSLGGNARRWRLGPFAARGSRLE